MTNVRNKVKLKLDRLALRNSKPNYLNKDLYRMLYEEEMYVMAYETIKTNKGAMTRGSTKSSIDGYSMKRIEKIIQQLRDGTFKPRPCRRTYILKDNGKLRPLGMPDIEEKLVQQCMTRILHCIYDSPYKPTFSTKSFGFRKGKGCHHALKEVYQSFKGSTWLIKADVKGFFDSVDQHILINLLRKRISDERFIQLIWKFCRSGYIEDGKFFKTIAGTPQGSIISPVLANIYLHEFDVFVQDMTTKYFTSMKRNPVYKKAMTKANQAKAIAEKAEPLSPEYNEAMQQHTKWYSLLLTLPSQVATNSDGFIIKYVRYADDWVLGIKGSHAHAKFVFNKCHQFFKKELNLEWNLEKSYLCKANTQKHEFLGIDIVFTRTKSIKIRRVYNQGRWSLKRTKYLNSINLECPTQKVLKRLRNGKYLSKDDKPLAVGKLLNLDEYTIALHFKSVMNGIQNYYSFVTNIEFIRRVHYLLVLSFVHTLCAKYRTKRTAIFKKYGHPLRIKRPDGKKTIEIGWLSKLKRDPTNFKVNAIPIDWTNIYFKGVSDTASWLKWERCCICNSNKQMEVHHIPHIKRRGHKYAGFEKVMGYINRKSIPCCYDCHQKIHNGEYDGTNLRKLEKVISIRLGIQKD